MDCSPTSLLHPWDFPGKNTGVGCQFLLQEVFPTQGLNPGLPHCRQTLYHLSHHFTLVYSKTLMNDAFILLNNKVNLESKSTYGEPYINGELMWNSVLQILHFSKDNGSKPELKSAENESCKVRNSK